MDKEKPKLAYAFELVQNFLRSKRRAEKKEAAKEEKGGKEGKEGSSSKDMKNSKADLTISKRSYGLTSIKSFIEEDKYKDKFTGAFRRLVSQTKSDIYEFTEERMNKFEWRNFTPFVALQHLTTRTGSEERSSTRRCSKCS